MTRFIARRLALIPIALLLVNFFGFTYAHAVRPMRAARTPYLGSVISTEPLSSAYTAYLRDLLRLDLGTMPAGFYMGSMHDGTETIAGALVDAGTASLGLLSLALAISVAVGLFLGLRSVRTDPPRAARLLPLLSTVGLAMPSFYIGSLLIVAVFWYVLSRPGTGMPLPIQGFGWDRHLVFPILALMVRPTMQIAQLSSGLLVEELGKQYIVAARSKGLTWRLVRVRHAMRNILATVIIAIAGSIRLLVGELVLVEWLFAWPGLGSLLAWTLVPGQLSSALGPPLFLNPPVVAAVLTAFAALFLVTDLIASVAARAIDPRLRSPEGEARSG